MHGPRKEKTCTKLIKPNHHPYVICRREGKYLFGWFFSKEKLFPINNIIPNKVPQQIKCLWVPFENFSPQWWDLRACERIKQLYGLPNIIYEGRGNLVTLSFPPFVDFRKTPCTLAFSMGEEKVPFFYSLVGMKMLRKENGWIKVFYLGP